MTLYATYGNLGYVDAAKKTVTADGYNVAAANVRTDISDIKYGAPVIVVYTTSTTDKTLHGMYVYPMTSTTGIVKSIAKENGAVESVTLEDGTVLKLSAFWDRAAAGVNEWYVIGTTGNYNDINTDQGVVYRFINVTSGEEQFFPVKDGDSVLEAGGYYDISATATASGLYVATPVDGGDNTYAAGYIVDNWTVVESGTSSNFYNAKGSLGTVYFDGTTVTFLVASGTGANMKVTPYTGIEAFKAAYKVASNGTMNLFHTAMSVSSTSTGAWKADVIFVFETSISTTSRYVFIPTDIDQDDWSNVSGGPDSYYVTYNGAYLEGEKISVSFDESQIRGTFTNGTLDRGFYVLRTSYANGAPVYWLGEVADNTGDCYYQHVWYLSTGDGINDDRFEARDGEVTIVDVTNPTHKITSLFELYTFMNAHTDWSLAFTVNPSTNRVDYIYAVNAGWDAKVTVSLTTDLLNAGWKISNNGKYVDSFTLTDADAKAYAGERTITLYNANLAKQTLNNTTYTATVNGANVTTTNLVNGTLTLKINVPTITSGTKTYSYEIGGLKLGDIKVTAQANSGLAVFDADDADAVELVYKNVTLGQQITVNVKMADNSEFHSADGVVWGSDYYWSGKVASTYKEYPVNGYLSSAKVLYFSFCPTQTMALAGSYSFTGIEWLHTAP